MNLSGVRATESSEAFSLAKNWGTFAVSDVYSRVSRWCQFEGKGVLSQSALNTTDSLTHIEFLQCKWYPDI